jgi:GT2 family glycosyltransferase
VETEFAVFLDNDVWVAPGWLEELVECADATGAAVVGPLTCIGEPMGEEIHFAGGEVAILEEPMNGGIRRHVQDRMWHPGKRVSKMRPELRRRQCTLAEFHCVLARKSILDAVGGFDEGMLNTREHLDFSLAVLNAGGTIYFEPNSEVTYMPGPPFTPSDVPFYMLRWSDAWERRSLEHFRQKWDLTEDEFFQRRYERLGWRRYVSLIRPASRRITLGRRSRVLEGALKRGDRLLNRYITSRHDRAAGKLGS